MTTRIFFDRAVGGGAKALLAWKLGGVVAIAGAFCLWLARTLEPARALDLTLAMVLGALAQASVRHWLGGPSDGAEGVDAITHLPDRRAFESEMQCAEARQGREANFAAVLMLDVDGFKDLNDELGSRGGDAVLLEIGERIRQSLRVGDVAARLGADEFAVLLPSLAKPEDAERVAERIQQKLSGPLASVPKDRSLSITIGIALQPLAELKREELMKNAGLALRLAKTDARGSMYVFADAMRQGVERRRRLEGALRRLPPADTFTLAYQPKYDVQTGRTVGFEALLRWTSPEHGFVSPAEFIPILEETGMIVEVGAFVLQTACDTLRQWQSRFERPDLTMAVNLSMRQLQDPGLVETVRAILAHNSLAPETLELEVTETMIMQKPEQAIAILESLRAERVKISVDDFGTGYSSLQYLKRLPLSSIKVDRSFVMGLPSDNDMAIVRATIGLGQSLGLTVIAEGVEKAEHLALLKEFGCDHAQGFFFSRPVPMKDAELLLQKAA